MSLRDLERASIRSFVEAHADKLTGRVLDLGCGLRPYQSIIEAAGGDYWGHDWWGYPGSVVEDTALNRSCVYYGDWNPLDGEDWDAVLMTQVWQYIRPHDFGCGDHFKVDRACLHSVLNGVLVSLTARGGCLIATGPTNWPHLESADRWRYTTDGVRDLLGRLGFREVEVAERAAVEFEGERWATGWGAVARA